jgi:hypothetical protein
VTKVGTAHTNPTAKSGSASLHPRLARRPRQHHRTQVDPGDVGKTLALDLKKIADGRQSLIPNMFRVRCRHSYSSILPATQIGLLRLSTQRVFLVAPHAIILVVAQMWKSWLYSEWCAGFAKLKL